MDSRYFYIENLKQAYFEVTNRCNLSCGYCYAFQIHDTEIYFELDFYKQIINTIAEYSKNPTIEIIFHGGEPLLKSSAYFLECFSYAKNTLTKAGKYADLGIQSNLTLFADAFLPIFKEFNVKVSSSIDGPGFIHNIARSQYKQTINNFIKIKENGITIAPIVVFSKHNFEHIEDIFKLFVQLNISSFQFNIAASNIRFKPKSKYKSLSADEIFTIYTEILKNCIKYNIKEVRTWKILKRFIDQSNAHLNSLGCDYPFCHAGTEMIVFTPDGNMYPCSPCVALTKLNMDYSLGRFQEKINKKKFISILKAFHNKDEKYYSECSTCKAARICEFNCPAFDRFDPITREHICEAFKRFYEILNLKTFEYINIT